jgi:hypothetical protein
MTAPLIQSSVRLLKDELRTLTCRSTSLLHAGSLKPEEERNTQDARSVFPSNLDAEITQAWLIIDRALNIRRDATSSD